MPCGISSNSQNLLDAGSLQSCAQIRHFSLYWESPVFVSLRTISVSVPPEQRMLDEPDAPCPAFPEIGMPVSIGMTFKYLSHVAIHWLCIFLSGTWEVLSSPFGARENIWIFWIQPLESKTPPSSCPLPCVESSSLGPRKIDNKIENDLKKTPSQCTVALSFLRVVYVIY